MQVLSFTSLKYVHSSNSLNYVLVLAAVPSCQQQVCPKTGILCDLHSIPKTEILALKWPVFDVILVLLKENDVQNPNFGLDLGSNRKSKILETLAQFNHLNAIWIPTANIMTVIKKNVLLFSSLCQQIQFQKHTTWTAIFQVIYFYAPTL